jgi:hypothetical protein
MAENAHEIHARAVDALRTPEVFRALGREGRARRRGHAARR